MPPWTAGNWLSRKPRPHGSAIKGTSVQRSEMSREGGRVSEWREVAVKGEPPGAMRSREPVEEQPAEQAGEDAHGQEEPGAAGDPARPVRGEPAAGHHDVHVRMVG